MPIMKRYRPKRGRFEAVLSSINFKNVPCFYGPDDKWLACEEFVLLTSLQHHSFGNWSLHAKILSGKFNKKFTAEEVREHYIKTYMEGDIAEAMQNTRKTNFVSSLKDHTSKEDDEILNNADINAHKNVPKEFLEKLGYMPLRQDFKEEYAPSAEGLIYDISFKNADDYDKNFNLIVLDAYRYKVNQRLKLKKAIKEFRLVEAYHAACKKKFHNNRFNHQNSEHSSSILNSSKDVNNFSSKKIRNHSMNGIVEESVSSLHLRGFTKAEAELCLNLGLKPSFYKRYKIFLLKKDLEGIPYATEDLIPEDMTVAQCFEIVNFMKKAGWIKTKNILNLYE